MSDFFAKMKSAFGPSQDLSDEGIKKNKRRNENLILLLVILVIVIVSINYVFKDGSSSINGAATKKTENSSNKSVETVGMSETLESRLKTILNKVKGVTDIDVLISYANDTKKVPVYNEKSTESNTEEVNGSNTKTTVQVDSDKNVAYEENGSTKSPLYEQNISPTVERCYNCRKRCIKYRY